MTVESTPTQGAAPRGRTLALAALLIVLGLLAWRLSDVLVLMFGAVMRISTIVDARFSVIVDGISG